MKRIIFIIAIILSSIVFPVMANANDSTEVNTTSPILQKQEVKLPWYKALSYETGYTGGICYVTKQFRTAHPSLVDLRVNFNWYNTLNFGVILPDKKLEIGIEYGFWPHLMGRWEVPCSLVLPDSMYYYNGYQQPGYVGRKYAIYFNGVYTDYHISQSSYAEYIGISFDHFIVNARETFVYISNDTIPGDIFRYFYTQWKCIGGMIYAGFEKHIPFKNVELVPFLRCQFGYAREYKNNMPSDWKRDKLTISTSGVFAGIKVRFGGGK